MLKFELLNISIAHQMEKVSQVTNLKYLNNIGYDEKLYTFKEMDYANDWAELIIDAKKTAPLPKVRYSTYV